MNGSFIGLSADAVPQQSRNQTILQEVTERTEKMYE
jgi:hypothetical protein